MASRSPSLDRARATADTRILKDFGLPQVGTEVPRRSRPDGAFQVALSPFQKAFFLNAMAATGADKRFDATLGTLTGGTFRDSELKALKNRALDKAEFSEAKALNGIEEGVPVIVTRKQKAAIDAIVGRLGGDDLGRRAQEGYQGAIRDGKIRVR